MKKNSRESRIISILDTKGEISVFELSRILDISASTLRKQLAEMQQKGLIIRTYGGVMSVNPVIDESFESKIHKNTSEKLRIAVKARSLIQNGASVALGSGTTVFSLSNAMNDMSSGTIYTNSMQVANYLCVCPKLEVHVCGGIIRSHTGTIIGNEVQKFFDDCSVDYAFLGCDALDINGNVYSDNLAACNSEAAVIKNAKKVYILCDSSKLGKKAVARITTLDRCTALITGLEARDAADKLKMLTTIIYA